MMRNRKYALMPRTYSRYPTMAIIAVITIKLIIGAENIPAGFGMLWFTPRKGAKRYGVLSFVCLNCGYLGNYLHTKDVIELREERKQRRESQPK